MREQGEQPTLAPEPSELSQAWAEVGGSWEEPLHTEVLKQAPKSTVVRCRVMRNSGHMHSKTFIAKRCTPDVARIEEAVHQRLLPELSVPCAHWIGASFEADRAWIFLEDLGEDVVTRDVRLPLAPWLGKLHGLGRAVKDDLLPRREVCVYLTHLRAGRARIAAFLEEYVVPADHVSVLRKLVDWCTQIEDGWDSVAWTANLLPATLVHGDIAIKHIRIRCSRHSRQLVLMDWELAGRGTPAPDLELLDPIEEVLPNPQLLRDYCAADPTGEASPEVVAHVSRVGSLLRALAGIDWASQGLLPTKGSRRFQKLSAYLAQLERRAPGVLE